MVLPIQMTNVKLTIKLPVKRWEFPKDRFVEWGPEDESFCRLAGYGREVESQEEHTFEDVRIKEIKQDVLFNKVDFIGMIPDKEIVMKTQPGKIQ